MDQQQDFRAVTGKVARAEQKAGKIWICRKRASGTWAVMGIKQDKSLEDIRADGYFERHPEAVVIKGRIPGTQKLHGWISRGIAEAVDGCRGIEPDGFCEHGKPAWTLALGVI